MAETRLCKLYKRNVLHNSQKEREREEEKNLLPSTISIKLRFKTQTLLPEYGKQINKAFSSLRQELKISLVQSSDSFWEEQITAGITSFRNIFLVMTKNCFLPVKCKSPRESLGFFFFFVCVSERLNMSSRLDTWEGRRFLQTSRICQISFNENEQRLRRRPYACRRYNYWSFTLLHVHR